MSRPLVSTIIPTFDRRDEVIGSVRSAIEQTYPADALEIIVVDDGSTDGTEEALARTFGNRIRYLGKPNGGVSSARNVGLAAARGHYLALLDSDDEWHPTKIEKQVSWLEAHPAFGMVITHVGCVGADRKIYEVYDRRIQIPEDGFVLRHVLRNPALVPPSVMFVRRVYEDVGGFDETLRTAEDLEFHLRVAARWPIGVLEEVLTLALRRDDGLSGLAQSYRDAITVIERFLADHADSIDPADADAALVSAYAHNIRGLVWAGEVGEALRCGLRGMTRARTLEDTRKVVGMSAALVHGLAARMRSHVKHALRRPGERLRTASSTRRDERAPG